MMLVLYTIYIVSCVLTGISSQVLEPTVTIGQGEIRGTVVTYSSDKTIWAFRGIPYAKPPIDSLRLKNPEKPDNWPSTLPATNFKSKCSQLDYQDKLDGSEDCLYINVFTPVRGAGSSSMSYPVMVFIHGGNFQKGSADMYDPKQLVTSENNVILVTFNYRIGVLGFLSTGDKTCPGNFGLKDQVMALNWIRENIENFGGDKNSITLFGQGAGAVSVFLHILSPQSKDLFHKAITQSGSPLCNWTLAENPYSHARVVAERLQCSTKSSQAMFDCIQKADISKLLEAQKNEKSFGDFPLEFTPVVDEEFLPDTPDNLLNSPNFRSIPLVSGINKDDGALFYPVIKSYEDALRRNSTNSSLVDEFLLHELIPMFLLTATGIRGNIESVSRAIHFQYFNSIDRANFTQFLQSFINMSTDAMFVSCNYRTLESYSAKGAPTYMYVFEYKGESSMLELEQRNKVEYNGVSFGDELIYLFDIQTTDFSPPLNDMIKGRLSYLWTFFATKGEFSSLSYMYSRWEPYSARLKNYYRLELNPSNESSYRQKEADLWLNHLPALSKIKPVGDSEKYKTGGSGLTWTMLAIAIILVVVVVALSVLLLRKSKNQYFSPKTEEK